MKETKIDRFSKCPNCEEDWEGEDVHTELNGLSIFTHKSPNEMEALASNYGWSKDKPSKFSKVIVLDIGGDKELYKCPNIRCSHLFDPETGLEYECLEDFELGKNKKITEILEELNEVAKGKDLNYTVIPIEEEAEGTIKDFEEARPKDTIELETTKPLITGTKGELDAGELEPDKFRKFFEEW